MLGFLKSKNHRKNKIFKIQPKYALRGDFLRRFHFWHLEGRPRNGKRRKINF